MKRVAILLLSVICLACCSTLKKIETIRNNSVAVNLAMTPKPGASPYEVPIDSPVGDTLVVKGADGREIFILKAVRDEKTGEMVANDVIEASVVTATFRNVAERDGRVALEFRITVPEVMLDSKWQIRFIPSLLLPQGPMALEQLVITGRDYRKEQLLGYERYNRFLETIISDTTKFIDKVMLDRFIQRYIPELYQFKNDSTYVSEEKFTSAFGVSASEALTHYTNHLSKRRNEVRKSKKGDMYRKYVKVPIESDGIRIDTLISEPKGNFIYDYQELIETSPGLRKIAVSITGGIWEGDRKLYSIPMEDSITFYISSLSSLAENRERYLTEIISRRVAANCSYGVAFKLGSAEICREMGSNGQELARIRENVTDILEGELFDLDSIVVSATSSPEGNFSLNRSLSKKRSESIVKYMKEEFSSSKEGVELLARSLPEDWETLVTLVGEDPGMNYIQREIFRKRMEIPDPDKREAAMRGDSYYHHMKDSLYPCLRRVKLDFHMHRKGMVQDTIWTTTLDTVYMNGVQALREGDYLRAAGLLHVYRDYNTALAYCSLNKNYTALSILEEVAVTPKVNYLLAIIYARLGDEQKAVQNYLLACSASGSFIHRGNLDPEISSLIRKYNLNGYQ